MNEFSFILIIFLAMMSPGPDWALIFQVSLSRGRIAGTAVAAGIALGITCHTGVALILVNWLSGATPGWYEALRWAGATYLVWLGWIIWKSTSAGALEETRGNQSQIKRSEWLQLLARGWICNLTNAKAFLFITTLFTQWNDPASSQSIAPWKLGAILILETLIVWTAFAWVIGASWIRKFLSRFRVWLDRSLAVALWMVALALALQ